MLCLFSVHSDNALMVMNPVLAEVYRNNVVESCHRGSAVVVDSQGQTILAIGDCDRKIYPRSSLKLFQTIPLLESGAADKFGLSDEEIVLACASHNAESFHTDAVQNWLHRLGLDNDDLECGADFPLSDTMKRGLLASGKKPASIHQNCSGKHVGMLTLARHLGVATRGYSEYQHPTQQAWMQTLSELVEVDVTTLDWERDGCGLPAICISMRRMAYGCALLACPQVVGGRRGQAMAKIIDAIQAHPRMLAGTGRCCSDVIRTSVSAGQMVVKIGAEGVYAGILPEQGWGLIIKIDDGATRASEVALGGLLLKLGAIDANTYAKLSRYFEPKIYNTQKKITGRISASSIWTH